VLPQKAAYVAEIGKEGDRMGHRDDVLMDGICAVEKTRKVQ